MIAEFKEVARQIANSRTRLAHPCEGKQTRQDILDEVKRMEQIEFSLLHLITEYENKIRELLR